MQQIDRLSHVRSNDSFYPLNKNCDGLTYDILDIVVMIF
jgi:hypothetical protein